MELKNKQKIKFNNQITYEVINKLGSGGQGSVYRVKDVSSQKEYALKILFDKDQNRKKMKEQNIRLLINDRINEEASKLSDPEKIKFTFPITSCTYENETMYIMELADGQTLNSIVDQKNGIIQKMSFNEKLELCLQIASAIKILNKLGCCYTDINWGNFIINFQSGFLYIVDCENCASNSDIQNGKFSFIFGTGFFMAPEVAFGLAKAGANADRYALATLIFKIFTNNLLPSPYHGKIMYSTTACQNMLEVKELVDEDEIEHGWDTFIFDPDDRRNSIDTLYKDASNKQGKLKEKREELESVMSIWDNIPNEIKSIFCKAFKDPLKSTSFNTRPSPIDWASAITKLFQEKGYKKDEKKNYLCKLTSVLTPKIKFPENNTKEATNITEKQERVHSVSSNGWFNKLKSFSPLSNAQVGGIFVGYKDFASSQSAKKSNYMQNLPDFKPVKTDVKKIIFSDNKSTNFKN